MEANDLEKPSEEELQSEIRRKKEYQMCLKDICISRNKKIKMNIKNYRRLLLEEQKRLLHEQKILQNRLQKYFDLESELKQIFSKITPNPNENNQELNQNQAMQIDQFKIIDFFINLQKNP